MGQTLWERLMYGQPKPPDLYNPLEARVGAHFALDLIDFRNLPPMRLVGITEYTRIIDAMVHKFSDYHLAGGREVRLRIMPRGPNFTSYLLSEDGVEPWNEQLHQALTDNTGRFEIAQGERTDVYLRVNNLTSPFAAILKKVDGDKAIKESRTSYWDFYRERQDVAGQPYTELLFVEEDEYQRDSGEVCLGQFTFLVGQEVDSHRVVML